MRSSLKSFQVLTTLTLSIACAILVVVWPGWLTTFRAEGGYSSTDGLKSTGVMGNLAIATATVQSRNIGIRLGELRRGATGVGQSGLSFKLDEQSLLLNAAIPSLEEGGGASADPSRRGGGLGLFLNGLGSFGDQRATSREPGFDFHTAGFTLGSDYKLTDNLILGAAFGYINGKADLDASAGHLTTNGYSLSAYGSYYIGEKMYLDGIATYGWNNYDGTRNITSPGNNETARSSPDGNQFSISVGSGYNFNFGPLTVGPSLRVNYLRVHIDNFQESGAGTFNLKVRSQNPESLTTDLGGQVSYAISMPWGVLLPLVRFEWEHEFKGSSRNITGSLVNDPATSVSVQTNDPDRDYFNLGAGLTATFKRGTSAFFYYEAVLGRSNFTNHLFTAGVRFEFE